VLNPGTKLGPYEIVSPLGAGGMGEVYRARDTKLNRDVALKVLPEVLARDPERMARFQREAQVLASLNHPNIAAIYGLEESVVTPPASAGATVTRALVMELVEGQTLAERIGSDWVGEHLHGAPAREGRKGPPLPLDDVLPIAKQIADALEYAHERGIIHRDLKPANVKITPEGTVKVLDFGLAKALDTDASAPTSNVSNSPTLTAMATQAGVILGTAAYMPPEQARGKTVDRRADIWAFGCVLYEMLAGKRLFEGETVSDTLAAVLKTDPDWGALPEETPPRVKELIRRSLTKDPKQRLQAIGEARIAMEETMAGVGADGVRPIDESAGAETGARRAPLRLLPWALAVALIAVVYLWKFAAPAPQSAMHFSAVTNFAGVQAEPAISPDGRSVAFVSNRDGNYNVYVGLVRGGSLIQITHDSNLESRPSWSPDGATLAYARLNHWGLWDIWEIPALGGMPRRVILNATDPDWSPDGHSLAYLNHTNGGIWISGISGENARQAVPPWTASGQVVFGWDTQPRFSPNGRQIAFAARYAEGGPDSRLAVADLDTGKTRLLANGGLMALSPTWSPDGQFIYFASSRGGTVNIWKIPSTGGEPEQITAGEGDDADLDVSKDGKRIVFGTLRLKIGISRLDLQEEPGQPGVKVLTTDPARNQVAPVFSPDGKHLAYFTNLKGVEHEAIWVSDADGSNAKPLAQDARVNIFPTWAPDSRSLIYASTPIESDENAEYRRAPISGGAPQTLFSVPKWSMSDVGVDGRMVFWGKNGQVETFDPRTAKRQPLGTTTGTARWEPLLWSPDQSSVAYMVDPRTEDDPKAGLWVDDFKNPPRQIFRGWVVWIARGPGNELYLLEGKPDLNGVLWKAGWNGQGLTRTSRSVPILYDDNYLHTQNDTFFDVSPDGRYLAFQTDQVLQENIGMIENVR
jgi:eukaryotic-like serine/threonine-protein kinase